MIKRKCLICNAYFLGDKEDTLKKLKNHKENCSRDEPYTNDNTADGYLYDWYLDTIKQ